MNDFIFMNGLGCCELHRAAQRDEQRETGARHGAQCQLRVIIETSEQSIVEQQRGGGLQLAVMVTLSV